MAVKVQLLRSSTANKRPTASALLAGELALNTAAGTSGAFFEDAGGNIIKLGPAEVGSTAPNASPAAGGSSGNTTGEFWFDTANAGGNSVDTLKIFDGSSFVSIGSVTIGSTDIAIGAAATTSLSGLASVSTTALTLNGFALSDILDEDNMASNSATAVPTQQSVKVYVDAVSSTLTETDTNVDDLITLSGVAENSTDLGTFTGSIITDNSTVKAALASFTRCLAEEERTHGIRACTLTLGAVDSSLWDSPTVESNFDRRAMLPVNQAAAALLHLAQQPATQVIEDLTLMPATGAF